MNQFFSNLFGNNINNNNSNQNNNNNNYRRRAAASASSPRQSSNSGSRGSSSRRNNNTMPSTNTDNSRNRSTAAAAAAARTTSTGTGSNNGNNAPSGNTNNNRNSQQQPQQQQQRQRQTPPRPTASTSYTYSQEYNVPPASFEQFFSQFLPEQLGQQFYQAQAGFFQQQHQQQPSNAPPPASDKSIRTLPRVMVTPEDLVDENNRECCICFESHELGDKVSRLPCAHIFHPHCITEWLNKHCTCPICRYELPTSNPIYESDRSKRMSARKPRFATYELQRMKISELKELCTNKLNIAFVGSGYTKEEIIDKIIKSGKVDIISAPPPMKMKNVALLRGMGVGKLKKTMMQAGVFFDARDVIEKEDMVQIFINSGRVVFEEDTDDEEDDKGEDGQEGERVVNEEETDDIEEKQSYDQVKRPRIDDEANSAEEASSVRESVMDVDDNDQLSTSSMDQTSAAASANINQESDDSEFPGGRACSNYDNHPSATTGTRSSSTTYSHYESADISSRSIGELKQLARTLGIDLSNCLEKREMIDLIVTALSRQGIGTRYGGGVVS